MSLGYHCDGPDCDEYVLTHQSAVADWIVVVDNAQQTFHFCTGWHMTRWGAAEFEPADEQPEQEQFIVVVHMDEEYEDDEEEDEEA
jgi:hypothetical protein